MNQDLYSVLTNKQREVMLLREDNLTTSEIAKHLGLATITVKFRLSRAKERLRCAQNFAQSAAVRNRNARAYV